MAETEKKTRTTLIKQNNSSNHLKKSSATNVESKKIKIKLKKPPVIQHNVESQNTPTMPHPDTHIKANYNVQTNPNNSSSNKTPETHINPNRKLNTEPYSSKQHFKSNHTTHTRHNQKTTSTGTYNKPGNNNSNYDKNNKDSKNSSNNLYNKNKKTDANSFKPRYQPTKTNKNSPITNPTAEATQASKRTFRTTTRKKQFVNKRKQFVEKNLIFSKNKKHEHTIVANPVPKSISIIESISVVDLAKKMNLKSSELLSKLMSMGTMANLNTVIDYETAQLLASEYECNITVVSLYDQTLIESKNPITEQKDNRPPVVTVMGHVDHGKTTLLDCIRKSKIVDTEQGKITQHLGTYMVNINNSKITFLDTPGHEAFTLMRSRGAKITDIIVLVIAADDGIMPQTLEVISLAKSSNVPIVVALNKIDSPASNPEKVLKQLAEHELMPEEWGGQVPVCQTSALKNEGIENLLDNIILQSEMMEIHANNSEPAKGVVLESKMEKGKGILISVLITTGILKLGDPFVSGIFHGKVRDITDDMGNTLREASPSMPVAIVGIEGMPNAGDPFEVTDNDKNAKQVSLRRQELNRRNVGENVKKVTADTLYDSLEQENINTLSIIIKGDVHGSVEAIKEALEKLTQDEIRVKVIHAAAGNINAADIQLASASNALVIGFHVRPSQQVQQLANQEKVVIQRYTLIFDVVDSIRKQLESMLSPIFKEEKIGEAIVREIFSVPKFGVIAGSYMQSGTINKDSIIKIVRNDKEIHTGKVSSLKRFKDDVNKVASGYECGIAVENTNDLQENDILMVYEKISVARTIKI